LLLSLERPEKGVFAACITPGDSMSIGNWAYRWAARPGFLSRTPPTIEHAVVCLSARFQGMLMNLTSRL
ncbi:hypothetical protein ACV334_33675, partial [Pseudomonas aeruginosa]